MQQSFILFQNSKSVSQMDFFMDVVIVDTNSNPVIGY